MGKYAGNSLGKDMARSTAYYHLLSKEKGFHDKIHIVIASRECGDIQFLLSQGVRRDRIVACDIDPVARERAASYDILAVGADIIETIEWVNANFSPKEIGSVNLDLCGTIPKTVAILNAVMKLTQCPIFYTFIRGRDGVTSSDARKALLRKRVEYQCDIKDNLWLEYQSNTLTSTGSPMCLCVL